MFRIVTFSLLALVVVNGNEIPVYGVTGLSVRLPCNIPIAAGNPDVEWSDMVWTTDAHPKLIFRSSSNPTFDVDLSHQNRQNYVVSNDFGLTIDGLAVDADPGRYTCRSIVDGTIYRRHYYLTVGEMPVCDGDVYLDEGDATVLSCQLGYSGHHPVLQWLRNGEPVDSEDEYDIRLARRVLTLPRVSHSHDEVKYTCRMSLGETTEECHRVLNVTYLVRDVRFVPEREKFRAGDDVKCVARGNPLPVVTLRPAGTQVRSGPGWQSLTVVQTWEGQSVALQCSATNSVGSKSETLSSNTTIHVTAPKRHTTTHSSPVPVADSHVSTHPGRHQPSTALPPPARKDHTRGHRKHHSTTTVHLPSEEEEDDGPASPSEDDSRKPGTVTYLESSEKTDQPTVKTLDKKDGSHATETENPAKATGPKPAKGRPTNAGDTIRIGSSSFILSVIIRFILGKI